MNLTLVQPVIEKEADSPALSSSDLNVRPRIEKDDVSGRIIFEIRGSVYSPQPDLATTIVFEMLDITQSQRDPLPVRIKDDPSLSEETVRISASNGILPVGTATLSDWTAIADIDYHNLHFARRGNRKILVTASINADHEQMNTPLALAQSVVVIHNPENGFLDEIELEPYIDHLGEVLAWTFVPKGHQPALQAGMTIKGNLKALLFKGLARLKSPQNLRKELIRELTRLSPRKRLIAILTQCMDVLCTRGEVVMTELHELDNLAISFKINRSRFRNLLEVHLPVTRMEQVDPGFILGIEPDMLPGDIKNYLSREYRKWNGRVTHSDSEVRKQAAAMLNIIAQAHTMV